MQYGVGICCAALLLSASVARTAPAQQQQPQVTINKYSFAPNTGNGEYSFEYELSDGSARSEQGELRNAGTENEFLRVMGSYGWTSPDGQVVLVDYTADDTGYRPRVRIQLLQAALPPRPATGAALAAPAAAVTPFSYPIPHSAVVPNYRAVGVVRSIVGR